MLKFKIHRIFFQALTLLFILNLTDFTFAEDICSDSSVGSGLPTIPNNFTKAENWNSGLQFDPTNPQTMNRNSSATLKIIGGIKPYSWSVQGTGFSLSEIKTEGLSNDITANNNACGSAIIKVTDGFQSQATGIIRVSGQGKWVLVHQETCGEVANSPGQGNCSVCSTVVFGGYRYRDCWWGGTNSSSRYTGPSCVKWPYTEDLSHSCCYDPGFYFCFNVKGLTNHEKWEWQCN